MWPLYNMQQSSHLLLYLRQFFQISGDVCRSIRFKDSSLISNKDRDEFSMMEQSLSMHFMRWWKYSKQRFVNYRFYLRNTSNQHLGSSFLRDCSTILISFQERRQRWNLQKNQNETARSYTFVSIDSSNISISYINIIYEKRATIHCKREMHPESSSDYQYKAFI